MSRKTTDALLDDAEISTRTMAVVLERQLVTVADLVATDPTGYPPNVLAELREFLKEEFGVAWGNEVVVAPFLPPMARQVPRLSLTRLPTSEIDSLTDRFGGIPNAPTANFPWPNNPANRPLDFVFQLRGKAGGGEIDLGDVALVSVFAELNGDFYEAENQAVILHRGVCDKAMRPVSGVEPQVAQQMTLSPGFDDSLLLLVEDPDDEEALKHLGASEDDLAAAHSLAFCSKVWGVPVGGNLDREQYDSQGRIMRCLVQLTDYDDWFLWHLFINVDCREAHLEVTRG